MYKARIRKPELDRADQVPFQRTRGGRRHFAAIRVRALVRTRQNSGGPLPPPACRASVRNRGRVAKSRSGLRHGISGVGLRALDGAVIAFCPVQSDSSAGNGPPTPPSHRGRIGRRLATLGTGVCLLAILLLLVRHSELVRQFARRRITAVLSSRQIDLRMGSLDYNLFTGSIDVRDLRLGSAAAADLPAFARVGRARLELSLIQLLHGRYVVQSGVVEDLDLQFVVDGDGRDNVPRPTSDPNHPGKSFDYLVSSLSISNGRVRYTDRARHADLSVSLLPVQLTGNAATARLHLPVERTRRHDSDRQPHRHRQSRLRAARFGS